MAEKKYRVRLGLLIQTTHDRDSYLGNYFHVRAYPVTIGRTQWEQQYHDARIDAGKVDDSYNDIAADTIRNAGSDDLCNGLRLGSLRIDSQGKDDDQPRHLYGFDYEYKDVFSVDTRRAGQMFKTLQTIEKKTAALEEKYGRPATFGAYVARIANAIGADAIVFVTTPDSGWHNKNGHRLYNLGDGAGRIDGIVREWIDAGIPKPAEHRPEPETAAQ